jgi:hypothetical protein
MMQLEEKGAMLETSRDYFTVLFKDVKEAMVLKALFLIMFD